MYLMYLRLALRVCSQGTVLQVVLKLCGILFYRDSSKNRFNGF